MFLLRWFYFTYFLKIKILYKISSNNIVFLSSLILLTNIIYFWCFKFIKNIDLSRLKLITQYVLPKPIQNLVLSIFYIFLFAIFLLL